MECITLPKNSGQYLLKDKHLGEYSEQEEKDLVLENLGVIEKLDALKGLIDAAVISSGGVVWDLEPTEGHTTYALSSDVIYKTLLKYVTKAELDEIIDQLYIHFLRLINNFDEDVILPIIEEEQLFYAEYASKLADLIVLVQSLESGTALSNYLGDSEILGITQKALTLLFNNIYNKISEINGDPVNNISVTADPDYFIDLATCDIKINSDNILEELKIYLNDVLTITTYNVREYTYTCRLHETTTIKIEAKMLGVLYIKEKTIDKFNPLFIGGGTEIIEPVTADLITAANSENAIPDSMLHESLKGAYTDRQVLNDGDKIFVICPTIRRHEFTSVTMSGMLQIPMTEFTYGPWTILQSINNYQAGTYLISLI